MYSYRHNLYNLPPLDNALALLHNINLSNELYSCLPSDPSDKLTAIYVAGLHELILTYPALQKDVKIFYAY